MYAYCRMQFSDQNRIREGLRKDSVYRWQIPENRKCQVCNHRTEQLSGYTRSRNVPSGSGPVFSEVCGWKPHNAGFFLL